MDGAGGCGLCRAFESGVGSVFLEASWIDSRALWLGVIVD